MPMPDAYTRPELATERAIARRLRAKVTAAGGCAYCLHAVHGWGRSACDAPNRTFPRCLATPGAKFEPDYDRLRGQP
ncbi:MAG: hypothetical protein KGO96_13975 [Elusimicrobia bacterium]|nr:hypothetical protein [Elusimicrobiota bacterium]